MEETFKAFIPIDIIEKGKRGEDGLPEKLEIAGVASSGKSGKYDVDGQYLDVNGYDFQPFLKSGFFNLEHKGREDYTNIVGEPTKAYVKDNEFHVEGVLYRDNPKAVGIWQLGQILKKSGSTRRIGYSIEGQATAKDPNNPNRVTKARITGCAITVSPKNDGTQLLFKGGEAIDYETQPNSEFLVDITDDKGIRWTVDKNLNLEKGGEGSRGGKVIGHTKSGKAIYEHSKPSDYKDFDSKDHHDAREIHYKQIDKYRKAKEGSDDHKKGMHHWNRMLQHDRRANMLEDKEKEPAIITGKIHQKIVEGKTDAQIQRELEDGDHRGNHSDQIKRARKVRAQIEAEIAAENSSKGKKKVSKAEVFTQLAALNLDGESCERVWMLAVQIDQKINNGSAK